MTKYSLAEGDLLMSVYLLIYADSKLGAAEVWTSRQALQDLYQKMLVTDLEYALDKKVEQDLYVVSFVIFSYPNVLCV